MHILITGAAQGIGRSLAIYFSQIPGAQLSLVDIQMSKLEELQTQLDCPSAIYYADLSQLKLIPKLIHDIEKAHGHLDVLINNAGIMIIQSIASFDWDSAIKMITIDFLTPLKMIHEVKAGMIARKRGTIINVSSMAGIVPIPGFNYYAAAKAGLAMFSEILRTELRAHDIEVITVYPGVINTALADQGKQSVTNSAVISWMPAGESDALAKAIFTAFQKKRKRVVYPHFYKMFQYVPDLGHWFTARFTPRPQK